jgi:hypothetical protein
MQLKFSCLEVYICKDCWPKARPELLKKCGHMRY